MENRGQVLVELLDHIEEKIPTKLTATTSFLFYDKSVDVTQLELIFTSIQGLPVGNCDVASIFTYLSSILATGSYTIFLFPQNDLLGVMVCFDDHINVCLELVKTLLSKISGRTVIGSEGVPSSYINAIDNNGAQIIFAFDPQNSTITGFMNAAVLENAANTISFLLKNNLQTDFASIGIRYFLSHLFRPTLSCTVYLGPFEIMHTGCVKSVKARAWQLTDILFSQDPSCYIEHRCETEEGWANAIVLGVRVKGPSCIFVNKEVDFDWTQFGVSVIPRYDWTGVLQLEILGEKDWAIVMILESTTPGLEIVAATFALKQLKQKNPTTFGYGGTHVELEHIGLSIQRLADSLQDFAPSSDIKKGASSILGKYYH